MHLRTERGARRRGPRSVVSRALLWFLCWSLLALVAVGLGSLAIANDLAKDGALREATLRSSTFGHSVAAPLVDRTVRAGPSARRVVLDSVLRSRLTDGSIVHIKIWDSAGRVIWADERSLVGKQFPMLPEVFALFGTTDSVASFSSLKGGDNVGEQPEGELLEVYTGAYDADGVAFVFETYWSTDQLHGDQVAIRHRLVPLVLGALVLFELTILPLALTLARRVDRGRAERSAVLRHALSSAQRERRRLAQDLHDGLLQDLAGLGYALPSVGAQLPPEAHHARTVITEAAAVVERDMAALRELLTDVYPADLATGGLSDAVAGLAHRASATGLVVDVHLDGEIVDAAVSVVQLTYQVVREGLRNVVKHADATHARVHASLTNGVVQVRVEDDGRGPQIAVGGQPHLGLRLLADTVNDAGGELALSPGEVAGSVLTASFSVIRLDVATPMPEAY